MLTYARADVLSTVQSSMSAGQDPTQTLSRLMDWAEAREVGHSIFPWEWTTHASLEAVMRIETDEVDGNDRAGQRRRRVYPYTPYEQDPTIAHDPSASGYGPQHPRLGEGRRPSRSIPSCTCAHDGFDSRLGRFVTPVRIDFHTPLSFVTPVRIDFHTPLSDVIPSYQYLPSDH